ncbi:hypothetical protein DFP73DRAFT_567231 [Morchella snyderi]|nr:hypothetical protein DFP73DRAFT_567231 [Morchella snyderi]
MTLGSETTALLHRSVDALIHLTEPAPYALLTPDERKSALRQLLVTTETAAKLAEDVHEDVLMAHPALPYAVAAGDTDIPMDTTAAESPDNDVEKMVIGLRAELEGVRRERLQVVEDDQKAVAETDRVIVAVGTVAKVVERWLALRQTGEDQLESLGKDLVRSKEETERRRVRFRAARGKSNDLEARVESANKKLVEAENVNIKLQANSQASEYEKECASWEVWEAKTHFENEMALEHKLAMEEEIERRDVERSVQETQRLLGELERMRREKVEIDLDTERLRMNVQRVREEVERSLDETKKREPKRVRGDFARTIVDMVVEDVEAEMLCKGFERSVQETERLRKELDRVRSELVVIHAEIQELMGKKGIYRDRITELHQKHQDETAAMDRLYVYLNKVEESAKRLETESVRVYSLEENVCKNLEISAQETERLRAEVNRFSSETGLQRMIAHVGGERPASLVVF